MSFNLKMKSSILLLAVCLIMPVTEILAQWRSLGPDYNPGLGVGRLECIAFDPGFDGKHNQIMYAGSPFGGLWKSINAGVSWSNKDVSTDMLPFPGVADIAIDPSHPNIIYIAMGTRYSRK